MKLIFYLTIVLFLSSCGKPETVLICGDHVCINKSEAEQYIQSEKSQQEFIENLQLDTEYSQGPVDGFVTVSTGDNLYEKLGGIEILVKDGIIVKIRSSASQFSKVTK